MINSIYRRGRKYLGLILQRYGLVEGTPDHLLRALLPSATDHKMLGYLNALARPPIDNSVAPFNPNYDLYRPPDL